MDSLRKIIKFMNENLYLFEDIYKNIHKNVLKASIC